MKSASTVSILLLSTLLIFGCQDSILAPEAGGDTTITEAAAKRIPGADQGGAPLTATLTGEAEAPGPGDPDGSGSATFTLNQGQRTVCFELTVENIAPATAAHIHVAPVGEPGLVVVPLTPPTSGSSTGCVEDVDPALIKDIRQNPDAYYVNVHNAEFKPGAIRGQLSR